MSQAHEIESVDFYRRGFVELPFDVTRLEKVINALEERELTWIEKYPGTVDLRPCPAAIFPELIDVLHEQDISSQLERHLNTSDFTLVHCQVRREIVRYAGSAGISYMPMHRDTYITQVGHVGNCPPVHKLIVYPLIQSERLSYVQPRLRVVPGSHRMMFDQPDMDVSMIIQVMQALGRPLTHSCVTISGSDTHALLFNTALLHDVVPCDRSLRIIYSFATHRQYSRVYAHDDVHRHVHVAYESKL